jgi:hypothetical protein
MRQRELGGGRKPVLGGMDRPGIILQIFQTPQRVHILIHKEYGNQIYVSMLKTSNVTKIPRITQVPTCHMSCSLKSAYGLFISYLLKMCRNF